MFRHFEGAMRLNFIRPFLAKCSVRIVFRFPFPPLFTSIHQAKATPFIKHTKAQNPVFTQVLCLFLSAHPQTG